MRFSQLFGNTLREDPSAAETPGYSLLLRGGFIHPYAVGIFGFLPLGLRVKAKVEKILREEMDRIGGQEILMPVVNPAEIWKRSGRWESVGEELGRFRDRAGRDLALAMTHEEAVTFLGSAEIRSYRDLPRLVYHLQTKWRDDPRPRAGLIRVREFTMLDSYSFDADPAGMEEQYRRHQAAYERIFHRCSLPVKAVGADLGMMGGKMAHEYMYLSPVGEDTILICPSCGYAANRQIATFRKSVLPQESPKPTEKVATPGVTSIEDLSAFLGISPAQTAKAVFFIARLSTPEGESEKFIFAMVRGDMEVNETKLANAVKALELRPAKEEEICAIGAEPGFASPIGTKNALVVVDDIIPQSANLVAGANEIGFHLRNVNYGRDFNASVVCDLATAAEGFACPDCGLPLTASRGVEVANIFQLGLRYSEPMECSYLDSAGGKKHVWMGSYGIGVGRLIACIAEEHHDEFGLTWPADVAPFTAIIVGLGCAAESEEVYALLQQAGVDVLYDDREERAGVKFMDADLIGIPFRFTVSERSLKQGGVEFKRRDHPEKTIIPVSQILSTLEKDPAQES